MNTLKVESELAEKYKYKQLPKELSTKYREYFKENIPDFLNLKGEYTSLMTHAEKEPEVICHGYNRIVVGDYGAFVEFSEDQAMVDNFIVKKGQEYRIDDPKYSKNVKYEWYTIDDGSDIKIYKQKKGVSYATYKAGMYYVSVHECKPA